MCFTALWNTPPDLKRKKKQKHSINFNQKTIIMNKLYYILTSIHSNDVLFHQD